MPKYYVESGPVQLILTADDAQHAAVRAFEWTCRKQNTLDLESPLELVLEAERRGWQLGDWVIVDERGFGRDDATCFAADEVVAFWQVGMAPQPADSLRSLHG